MRFFTELGVAIDQGEGHGDLNVCRSLILLVKLTQEFGGR